MKPKYLGKMSWDEYVSIPYDVTKSELVYMDRSPMHYLAAKTNHRTQNAILDLISETKQIAKMRAMRKHNDEFVQFERQKALDKQEQMAQ